MRKDKREKERTKEVSDGAPSKYASRSASEAVDSVLGYKACFQELPANEKQLADKSRRLADLCQYFAEHKVDIPEDIVERVAGLSKLRVPERVRALVEVNHDLMEYLNTVAKVAGKPQ